MYTNRTIDNLLSELDSVIREVDALSNDGCQEIVGLGEEYHLNSLKCLKNRLQSFRNELQQSYDNDKRTIEMVERAKQAQLEQSRRNSYTAVNTAPKTTTSKSTKSKSTSSKKTSSKNQKSSSKKSKK